MLLKILLSCHASHAILSIQNQTCPTIGVEHGGRGSQLFEPASGFLAAHAIAGARQNRRPDGLQCHLAASAYRREMFGLLLVHNDLQRAWRQLCSPGASWPVRAIFSV